MTISLFSGSALLRAPLLIGLALAGGVARASGPLHSVEAVLADPSRAHDPRLVPPGEGERAERFDFLRLWDLNPPSADGHFEAEEERNSAWDAVFGAPSASREYRLGFFWDGPAPYARSEDEVFFPASTSKLWTAHHALLALGRDFRFETRVTWKSDAAQPGVAWELTLLGDGDPSWGMLELGEPDFADRIRKFVDELRRLGIREVRGPVRALSADSRWETVRFPEGWRDEDLVSCYGVQPQAFSLGGNCAEMMVEGPGDIRFSQREVSVPIQDELRWGTVTRVKIEAIDLPGVSTAGFRVSGTWRRGSASLREWLPIHDVRTWVERVLTRELSQSGIVLENIAGELAPKGAIEQALTFKSPPLSEILVPFLKQSLNWIGEALVRKIGQVNGDRGNPDLLALGQAELAVRVREVTAADPRLSPVLLLDGSGVSHGSATTPRANRVLLETLLRSPDFEVIWNALPIAGVDGTLGKRMTGTRAQGWLRAKTGTLSDAYNLSGYVPDSRWTGEGTPSPEWLLPFVTLVHTTRSNGSDARAVIDRTGARLSVLQRGR